MDRSCVFEDIIEVNARIIDVEDGSIIAAENVKARNTEKLEGLVVAMAEKIIRDFPLEGYIVQRRGDFYQFEWKIAGSTYNGAGRFQGENLVIDWGDASPVIYRLTADGRLNGIWHNGSASEILIPAGQ